MFQVDEFCKGGGRAVFSTTLVADLPQLETFGNGLAQISGQGALEKAPGKASLADSISFGKGM